MDGHEDQVTAREAHVVGGVSVQQIVVDVESVDGGSTPPDQNVPEGSLVRRASRRVQGGERWPRARDTIAAWAQHIARKEDLVAAESRRRDVEPGRSTCAAAHTGIHATEPRIKNVLQ